MFDLYYCIRLYISIINDNEVLLENIELIKVNSPPSTLIRLPFIKYLLHLFINYFQGNYPDPEKVIINIS